MEIEIRAKLKTPKAIIARLKKDRAVKFVGEKVERDLYFKHATDRKRQLVLRIRRTKNGDMLTFKAKSSGDDTAWPDVDLPLADAPALEGILRGANYEEVVRISKTRSTYKSGHFEINIDHIKELGWYIEIEGRGTQKQRPQIERALEQMFLSFGIQESDIVRQGYVPLAIAKQNKS